MKGCFATAVLGVFLSLAMTAAARADGLIHSVPADGTWARFDVTGEGQGADGKVTVTLKGTMTLKSVGREQVEGAECRWIEMETALEFQRADGRQGKQNETLKLLIPVKHLTTGENPRAHVLKAWKKREGQPAAELDLKGADAREVESLEELFHAALAESKKEQGVELEVPAGKFACTFVTGREVSNEGASEVTTQTWLADKAPFGVAAYRHTLVRKRGNESLGGRWMELKLAATGKDARSAIGP